MSNTLTTADCRYLVFFTIDGSLLSRGNTASRAIESAILGGQLLNPDAVEVIDCGEEGRKIWLHNQSAKMPLFLSHVRRRHTTVYRGSFYDSPQWYGSYLPFIPLVEL